MKTFNTTTDLIEKMIQANSSLIESPEDKISSEVEYLELSQIVAPEWLIKRYQQDPEEQAALKFWEPLIDSGSPMPPLVVDKFNNLIDGFHRFIACQNQQLSHAACLRFNNKLILTPME